MSTNPYSSLKRVTWFANLKPTNPNKNILRSIRRARQVLQATPRWADWGAIRKIYKECKKRNASEGEVIWSVDHVVPLNHPRVCGLHCEANLEVIRHIVNMKKGNHHWPGMPMEPRSLLPVAEQLRLFI